MQGADKATGNILTMKKSGRQAEMTGYGQQGIPDTTD